MAQKFVLRASNSEFDFLNNNVAHFRFGRVIMHKELVGENDRCFGGGDYELDNEKKTLNLSGESFDFGPPHFDWVDKIYADEDLADYKIFYNGKDITNLFTFED